MASGFISTSQLPENFNFTDFPQQINQQNRNMAAVPPSPVVDSWVDNPNVGKFNPGTEAGQAIFENMTKGTKEENLLTATNKDAQVIRRFLKNKAPALGKVVTKIQLNGET